MSGPSELSAADERVGLVGRAHRTEDGAVRFGYAGVTLRVRFESDALALRVESTTSDSVLGVIVDGAPLQRLRVPNEPSEIWLARDLGPGSHELSLVHLTETRHGVVTVRGFVLEAGEFLAPSARPERRLLFVGASVTCGEGVARGPNCSKDTSTWNAYGSYGMVAARALGAEAHLVCYGGRGLLRDWRGATDVLNAPAFFDLAIAEPTRPVSWDHTAYSPHAVVISLGTNDFNLGLGAFPEREEYVSAYVAFVTRVRRAHPTAHVFVTEGSVVDDRDAQRPRKTTLRAYLTEAVERLQDPHVHLLLAEHHPGDDCDRHPTAEQHSAMAGALVPPLRSVLGW